MPLLPSSFVQKGATRGEGSGDETRESRAWLACEVDYFVESPAQDLLFQLVDRCTDAFPTLRKQLKESWRESLQQLQDGLRTAPLRNSLTGVLLEFPLLRLHRRIDVILLHGDVAIVIELKMGDGTGLFSAVEQVEDYALCLRDFHQPCRNMHLMPVVMGMVRFGPPERRIPRGLVDSVAPVTAFALSDLGGVITLSQRYRRSDRPGPTLREFDQGAYNPTPDIVTAAKEAYAEHGVEAIRRSDAPGLALEAARSRLLSVVEEARSQKKHVICFVTGTPGAGKTLLGLDLVLNNETGRLHGEPAALLSGNRPLVRVLQDALIEDEANRTGATKKAIRRKVQGALQTLLEYLKHHADENGGPPPEHVVVFDEAQRAWDEATSEELLKRRASEPALFLEILSRLDWACLVCLVGGGQEINRGEVGLPLWVDALLAADTQGSHWEIRGPADCLERGRAEMGLPPAAEALTNADLNLIEERRFELLGSLRAYRNEQQSDWLQALLAGEIDTACEIAATMNPPPAFLCRELETARQWLRNRMRGGRRVGLLASSGAVRLRADGVMPTVQSSDLSSISHWFLKPGTDFRSSNALELPLSE